ncbi:hypothetical protein ACHAW6_001188 [Cyclotella cf. meneghiniana]
MMKKCTSSNLRRKLTECIFVRRHATESACVWRLSPKNLSLPRGMSQSWHRPHPHCSPRSSSCRADKQQITRRFGSSSLTSLRPPTKRDLAHFRSILAPHQIITTLDDNNNNDNDDDDELDSYNRDWTNRYQGHSALVLRPQTTQQVSSIVAHCHQHRIPLVPRGGNTGLCGGSTPLSYEVVLSLEFMKDVYSIEPSSGILHAQAGCTLHDLHEYASQRGHLFPLDIGSKGTCQIGGNVSTNAGGQYYYRWGGLHGNVVGLEVVLPDGRVLRLNMPRGPRDFADTMDNAGSFRGGCHRKDNTGYDLKHLFIGAEGTLGVITELAVACPPLPTSKHVVMLVCESYSAVLEVLAHAKQELGEILSAIELMDWQTLSLVRNSLPVAGGTGEALLLDQMLHTNHGINTVYSPSYSQSIPTPTPLYLLVETQGSNSEHDASKMDSFLTRLYEASTISNGFLAADSKRMHTLWNIREACNPAVSRSGYVYKYDVSLPIEEYMDVANEVKERLSSRGALDLFPETAVCVWGHLADGNAHINVVTPGIFRKDELLASHVDELVYGSVLRRRGSISAEHGIGQSKNEILRQIKDASVMDVMVQLKQLFDPHGIMNPGKVLPTDTLLRNHDQSK